MKLKIKIFGNIYLKIKNHKIKNHLTKVVLRMMVMIENVKINNNTNYKNLL